MSFHRLEIKICGLRDPAEAAACAAAGADAIGLVFYEPSPRAVTPQQARRVVNALPHGVEAVGVFVNEAVARVRAIAEEAGLFSVQLHGEETPDMVEDLRAGGLRVIKALKSLKDGGEKLLQDAARYAAADAWLVEGGMRGGALPGGNGLAWAWSGASTLHCAARPFALAGGLSPENIREAILAARPHAVDLSSGVERAPGVKDLARVAATVAVVRAAGVEGRVAPVFCRRPAAGGKGGRA